LSSAQYPAFEIPLEQNPTVPVGMFALESQLVAFSAPNRYPLGRKMLQSGAALAASQFGRYAYGLGRFWGGGRL